MLQDGVDEGHDKEVLERSGAGVKQEERLAPFISQFAFLHSVLVCFHVSPHTLPPPRAAGPDGAGLGPE